MKKLLNLFVSMIALIGGMIFISGCEVNPVMSDENLDMSNKKYPSKMVTLQDQDTSAVNYTYYYNANSNYLVINYNQSVSGNRTINVNFNKIVTGRSATEQTFEHFYTETVLCNNTTTSDTITITVLDMYKGVRYLGFEGITINEFDGNRIQKDKVSDYTFNTDQYTYALIYVRIIPIGTTKMKVFYNSNITSGNDKLETPLLVEVFDSVEINTMYKLTSKFKSSKFLYFSHVEFE